MPPNAVILSVTVILSLSLSLLPHARLDSSPAATVAAIPKAEVAASTPSWHTQAAAAAEEEEKEKSDSFTIETTTVDLRRPVYLNADQIAHSFRLPSGGRRHVARPLRPAVEISYGNDMVESNKEDGKKEKERRHHHDDDDSDSDSDDDDEEIDQQKKMRKRLRKMMKKKLKMERERENSGGFVNWISRFFHRF